MSTLDASRCCQGWTADDSATGLTPQQVPAQSGGGGLQLDQDGRSNRQAARPRPGLRQALVRTDRHPYCAPESPDPTSRTNALPRVNPRPIVKRVAFWLHLSVVPQPAMGSCCSELQFDKLFDVKPPGAGVEARDSDGDRMGSMRSQGLCRPTSFAGVVGQVVPSHDHHPPIKHTTDKSSLLYRPCTGHPRITHTFCTRLTTLASTLRRGSAERK